MKWTAGSTCFVERLQPVAVIENDAVEGKTAGAISWSMRERVGSRHRRERWFKQKQKGFAPRKGGTAEDMGTALGRWERVGRQPEMFCSR